MISTTSWKKDSIAGLVVFLVALPLCLGIALASGAPLFSGIIAGIVGGLVVTLLSGSALGVSGPAAGLVVIVSSAITKLGFEAFLISVMIAGVLQIIAGVARAGIIAHYFPSAVIKGMLAGIGLIMVLKQIPHAFGYDASWMGELGFIQDDNENTFSEIYYALLNSSPGVILITLISLGILLFWESTFVQQRKKWKLVPAPLVAVVAGILLNKGYQFFLPSMALKSSQLVQLPSAESIREFFSFFSLPNWAHLANPDVYIVGGTLALIASLETLLCVEATDRLDPQRRVTPTNQELKAQGIGNIVCGFLGGLPLTQVIVRSAANVEAGGKTSFSSFIHGIFLLLSVALIPELLNHIPLASLAAILLVVGYKLTKVSTYQQMYQLGWQQFLPFLATVVALVLTDMLTGVLLGLAIGIFNILLYNYKIDYFREDAGDGKHFTLRFTEHMSFLNKASVTKVLREIPRGSHVVIDGTQSSFIDYDVREVIQHFVIHSSSEEIAVEVRGIQGIDIPEKLSNV